MMKREVGIVVALLAIARRLSHSPRRAAAAPRDSASHLARPGSRRRTRSRLRPRRPPQRAGSSIHLSRRTGGRIAAVRLDRKSTRLNSSHLVISYAVFCLKKKKNSQFEPPQQKKKKIIRRRAL